MNSPFNEKNLIKVRQICFIYIAFMPVNKFIFLPSRLASLAFEQLWVSLLLNFVIDGLILLALLRVSEAKGNKTFYTYIRERFGDVTAKIIYFILAVFFLLKSIVPIFEHKAYVESTLYEMMPQSLIFFTFFIVSTYLCLKGLKVVGRCADIAVWLTAAGLMIGLFLSVGYADYSNLLPLIQKPAYNTVNATFRSVLWHGDSLWFLLISGHFREEKLYKTKITVSYAVGALATVFCIMTFYGVYGPISASQNYAFSAVSVFSVIVTNIGRFDFISVFLVLFSEIFAISLPLVMATKCLERTFATKNSFIHAIIVNAIALTMTMLFSSDILKVLELYENYFFYVFAGVLLISIIIFATAKRTQNPNSSAMEAEVENVKT